jgi:hypothetical protein
LTEEESKDIQSPSIMVVLPKLQVNRNTARTIVFGPTKYGGLAIPTVYSKQSYGQLAYFTGHVNLQDKTGKLLLISLSYLQLLSGSDLSILQQPFLPYKRWIENVWLTSLWAFLSQVKYKLVVTQEWLPVRARYNDQTLMTHFMALGFSRQQLGQLNRCRLYIQVIFLSDIVSADGRIIIPDSKEGIRTVDRVSTLNWPIQDRPSKQAWRLWEQALWNFENRGRLMLPLKQWVGDTHQRW